MFFCGFFSSTSAMKVFWDKASPIYFSLASIRSMAVESHRMFPLALRTPLRVSVCAIFLDVLPSRYIWNICFTISACSGMISTLPSPAIR